MTTDGSAKAPETTRASLRALAEKGKGTVWKATDVGGSLVFTGGDSDEISAFYAYIAAASPQVILELLDELERLKQENQVVLGAYRRVSAERLVGGARLDAAEKLAAAAMKVARSDALQHYDMLYDTLTSALNTYRPTGSGRP